MTEGGSKSIKLPTWNGDREAFQLWWTRFKAYASKDGWAKALKPSFANELPSKEEGAFDSNPAIAKTQKEAVKMNSEAVWAITMALTSNSIMTKYYATIDDDYPEGVAWKTIHAILTEYQPKDDIAAIEYHDRLALVSMKDNEDPKVLYEKLNVIRNMYSHANFVVQESELVSMAMQKAPDLYKASLAQEQRIRRRVDNKPLTLDDVYQVMSEMYRMNIGNVKKTKGGKSGKEVALAGAEGSEGGAKCYNCGKTGHKAAQCPNKSNDGQGRNKFTGKCNLCGKVGHKKADCWDLPANADKRPSNYKPKNHEPTGGREEAGAVGVETLLGNLDIDLLDAFNENEHDESVILDSLPEWVVEATEVGAAVGDGEWATLSEELTTLPDSFELLKDPEIWIGDSGASRHSTFSPIGFYNRRSGDEDDRITVGNGETINPDAIGDLKVTVCNKHGVKMSDAVIQDVIYSKVTRFNMFSITKCIKKGWKLTGDSECGLILTKDGVEVRFDIKISTKSGVLYCALLKRHMVEGDIGAVVLSNNQDSSIRLNIKTAHDRLGHCDEERTRDTARLLNWSITRGTLPPCRDCAAAKARQRNVPQVSNHVPTEDINGRVFLDVSTIKGTDDMSVTNQVWLIKVDEATGMKFSTFHSSKNAIVEPTCQQFSLWKQQGKAVKVIRCDNAGENNCWSKGQMVLLGNCLLNLSIPQGTPLSKTVLLKSPLQLLPTVGEP
jgi:Arginine methyltransferase-interacting protein, contains RING Zn-finger